MKNCTATSFWARLSAVSDSARLPQNRQMMTTLANPSIALSTPKPISATELARTPATTATTPSTVIQARLDHASSLARRIRRSRSATPRGCRCGSAVTAT